MHNSQALRSIRTCAEHGKLACASHGVFGCPLAVMSSCNTCGFHQYTRVWTVLKNLRIYRMPLSSCFLCFTTHTLATWTRRAGQCPCQTSWTSADMMPDWPPKQLLNYSRLRHLIIYLKHGVGCLPAMPTWFSQLTQLETCTIVV